MRKRSGIATSEIKSDPNAWMVTFGDLLMLLLTFFVMLLTMKAMDGHDTKWMFEYFSSSQGPFPYQKGKEEDVSPSVGKMVTISNSEMLKKALSLMEGIESPKTQKGDISVIKSLLEIEGDDRGVVIILESHHFFDTGEAEIKPEGLPVLDLVAKLLANAKNDILIMGHTDDVPLKKGKFESNRGLSFYRALSVFNYLTDRRGLNANRFAAGGYGELMPRYPNDSDENRTKNRRVEFILRQR